MNDGMNQIFNRIRKVRFGSNLVLKLYKYIDYLLFIFNLDSLQHKRVFLLLDCTECPIIWHTTAHVYLISPHEPVRIKTITKAIFATHKSSSWHIHAGHVDFLMITMLVVDVCLQSSIMMTDMLSIRKKKNPKTHYVTP